MDIIHADHLSLTYGATEVFTDLGFTIQRGSFTLIVGPNGAGKTQLMRVLLGLVKPTSGMIRRQFDLAEVGYVPQKLTVDPTFPITVREFLQSYIYPKGWWVNRSLPAFAEAFAIAPLLNKRLGQLSGGQLQRVLLAAVLSTEPALVFLDEFSSGIDPRGQAELFSYLHRLNERDGITLIMISHDIDIVSQFADVVLCLNKRMVCHGRPHDVFTQENFEKMYGIPLTKLEQHHHHD